MINKKEKERMKTCKHGKKYIEGLTTPVCCLIEKIEKREKEVFLYTCPKCTNGFYIKSGFVNSNCIYCRVLRDKYTWKGIEVKEICFGEKKMKYKDYYFKSYYRGVFSGIR